MVEEVCKDTFTAVGTAIARVKQDNPGSYDTPLWGRKNTEHMKNLGFVIGYEDAARQQWFRLDFDPNASKLLHINWEQDTQDSVGSKTRRKKCYHIRPIVLNPEDEMYTWWRSWTLHHCTELPEDIRGLMGGKRVWHGAYWL